MAKKKTSSGSRQLAHRETAVKVPASVKVPKKLANDLRKMIDESRQQVAQTVNSAIVTLYWNIGKRVREDVLKEKRAEYGEQIVSSLSTQLTAE